MSCPSLGWVVTGRLRSAGPECESAPDLLGERHTRTTTDGARPPQTVRNRLPPVGLPARAVIDDGFTQPLVWILIGAPSVHGRRGNVGSVRIMAG